MGGSRVERAQVFRPVIGSVAQRNAAAGQQVLERQAIRLRQARRLRERQAIRSEKRDGQFQARLLWRQAGRLHHIIIKCQRHGRNLRRGYFAPSLDFDR